MARANSLNLHGKLIKSRMGVDFSSIELVQDEDNNARYWLNFSYSSNEKGKVSVYYCATQMTNPEGLPTYFTIPPELPAAGIIKVKKGIGKKFKDHEECCFDLTKYEGMPLFNHTMNYYPGIITIEPRAAAVINETGVSDYQNLITYCMFSIDKKTSLLKIKPIKQVLIAFDMGFNLQRIYGMEDAIEENKNDEITGMDIYNVEASQQGVICISEDKNTVVMPCGHLCICKDGATAMSKQNSPDGPVGRMKVQSFVPLNLKSIKGLENQAVAKGKEYQE